MTLGSKTSSVRPRVVAARRPRVVVADDAADVRDLIARVLIDDGYEVVVARDGDEALRAVRTEPPPDGIVLDMYMPELSGLALLQGLRRDGCTIPIVVVSAYGEQLRTRAERAGANAVLSKPFELHDLLTTLTNVLASPTGSEAAATAAPDDSTSREVG